MNARHWIRNLIGRPPAVAPVDAPVRAPDPQTIRFQAVFGQLESPDGAERAAAAMLIGALLPAAAVRPLVRAYMHHADRGVLETLSLYGDKVTLVASREVADAARSGTQRARLMNILGACGDPGARAVVRQVVGDLSPVAHVAACAALVRLGDAGGVELIDQTLMSIDPDRRLLAMNAARALDDPAVATMLEGAVDRYLSAGKAVPRDVAVAMPLLLDPVADLPGLIAAHVRGGRHALTIVIGPDAAAMAERRREDLVLQLPGYDVYFTTERHLPAEQFDVLARARDKAAGGGRRRVALIGTLPSPGGNYPPPHFLLGPEGPTYTVRIMFVGQQDFSVIMDWWYYIDERSEVPTDFEVVVTALTLGGDRMTDEELAYYQLAGEDRREAFARALLAHRTAIA
jgi:hypothetical protein